MNQSKFAARGEKIIHDEVIAELAVAVEKRLTSMNVSQASIWLAGYVMGRLAGGNGGIDIDVFEDPLLISLLDTTDPILKDMIATREAGG